MLDDMTFCLINRDIPVINYSCDPAVEKKRKKRMKQAGLLKEEAQSYDTLVCILTILLYNYFRETHVYYVHLPHPQLLNSNTV